MLPCSEAVFCPRFSTKELGVVFYIIIVRRLPTVLWLFCYQTHTACAAHMPMTGKLLWVKFSFIRFARRTHCCSKVEQHDGRYTTNKRGKHDPHDTLCALLCVCVCVCACMCILQIVCVCRALRSADIYWHFRARACVKDGGGGRVARVTLQTAAAAGRISSRPSIAFGRGRQMVPEVE